MEKWIKFKEFIAKKVISKDSKVSEKQMVYSAILALYAGDEAEDVFSDLSNLYERYPQEVEFYIP